MALTATQKAENRKDISAGKAPRNKAAALSATSGLVADGTYGADEAVLISENVLRLASVEDVFQDFDLLA